MLLWIDLETTGLSSVDDYVLEVAWTITDNSLVTVDDVYTHVCDISPKAWVQLTQTPEVLEMHRNTGLLTEIDEAKDLMRLEDIEDQIIDQLKNVNTEEQIMVAGFSVHFDLGFINEHMPRLAKMLSHRTYDVTTLKTFFKSVHVSHNVENYGKHRAHYDIVEALSIAREYRDYVLKGI
jgi:oligoribonuclease (3'-5' exoribonuclease)